MTFRRMLHFFPLIKFGTDAFFRVHFAVNRELILGLFLSQGRKPQVNIPHARTVVSCKSEHAASQDSGLSQSIEKFRSRLLYHS